MKHLRRYLIKFYLAVLVILLSASLFGCNSSLVESSAINYRSNNKDEPNSEVTGLSSNQSSSNSSNSINQENNVDSNSSFRLIKMLNDKTKTAYTIEENTFQKQNTIIYYPQITGINDTSFQERINSMIYIAAFRYMDEEVENTLEVNSHIKLANNSLLSIVFDRYQSFDHAAHPINSFYSINIDLMNGQIFSIDTVYNLRQDMFSEVSKEIYFKTGLIENYDVLIKEYLAKDIASGIYATIESDKFYFTDDRLGVSLELPHTLGSHIEFEVPYNMVSEWEI